MKEDSCGRAHEYIMIFNNLHLDGAVLVELEKKEDERGFFARSFCEQEFAQHGLSSRFVQMNNSLSAMKGTLRGLHYQLTPMSEEKIVRCIRGALYDVILDLRTGSQTFGQWHGEELNENNRRMLYVPKGFAHGFITLSDNTEMFYFVSQSYSRERERGIRWDDPKFKIQWPMIPHYISDRDQRHPDFEPSHHLFS